MKYFVNRTRKGVALRRKCLLWVLIPPCLYLLFQGLWPSYCRVSQELPANPAAVLTQPLAPAGGTTLSDLVAQPELLFLNQSGLTELHRRLHRTLRLERCEDPEDAIRNYVRPRMTLTGHTNSVSVRYSGEDPRTGRILVQFFIARLQSLLDAEGRTDLPALRKEIVRVPWQIERLTPAAWILALSLFMALTILVTIEWMDPSLRTVRHAARYLELPVLGVMPDLQRLSAAMKARPPAAGDKAKS